VTVAEAEVRSVIVALVMVVVASVEVPDTVSDVAEAVPRLDVPEVSVEKIPVVKVGLGVSAIVLVPENMILDPAMRLEIGLL
jgi:hypothetical protein